MKSFQDPLQTFVHFLLYVHFMFRTREALRRHMAFSRSKARGIGGAEGAMLPDGIGYNRLRIEENCTCCEILE